MNFEFLLPSPTHLLHEVKVLICQLSDYINNKLVNYIIFEI
jgi:hypothetical protein